MTEENEISRFFELLSAAKWWVLGVALVSALVAGALGWSGKTLYEASVPVRVQFPTSLARAPQPERFAQLVKSPSTVAEAARVAGISSQAAALEQSIQTAVAPNDPRVVGISVQTTNADSGTVFLKALVGRAKDEAMSTVRDEIAGVEQSRKVNARLQAQISKVVAEGTRVGRSLRGAGVTNGERLLSEVGLLQMSVSALQSQATLTNSESQLDADLEALNNSVVLDGRVSVRVVSPIQRVSGYALRGLIVGLVIALVALYLPPVRDRFGSRAH